MKAYKDQSIGTAFYFFTSYTKEKSNKSYITYTSKIL